MRVPVEGSYLGGRLMAALGIKDLALRSISIRCALDEVATASLEVLIPDTAVEDIMCIMREYKLAEQEHENLSPTEELPH